jgi:DNA-binding CsgD family transcriptional regulator
VIEREPIPQPLPYLAPGPWISRGRVLDYELWEDRDRFVELDRRISRRPLPPRMLAARNRRIFRMLAAGKSSAQIARVDQMEAATVRKVKQREGIRARPLAAAA